MSITVTNYLSQINRDFPVRGQDNDAQVFRDNWQNIYDAIATANSELEFLDNSTVKINSTTTFNGNTLEDINFKNESIEVYTLDFQSGKIELDYSKGSYQKFPVLAGPHELTVINWPEGNKSGKLILAITAPCDKYSAINFPASYKNLSTQPLPIELAYDKPNIFELWNEEGDSVVYVRYLTNYTYDVSTSTDTLWMNRLKIGIVNNNNESNTYYTGTNKSTIVQRGNQFGELALVPNRVSKTVLEAIDKTSTTPVEIKLGDATDIVPGAFTYISNLSTKFTVVEVTPTSVFIEPGDFNINLLLTPEPLIFTNPTFTEQPTVLTLESNPTNSEFGSKSNYVGSVYADKNKLEVTFNDYGSNNTNTFVVKTLEDPTKTSTVGMELASTEFIHNLLPIGSVIMWYGKISDIPYGWTLCDDKGTVATIINGQSGPNIRVPNLTNRFVVGGSSDVFSQAGSQFVGPGSVVASTSPATTGGSADSVVVRHYHTATFFGTELEPHDHSIIDPGHTHTDGRFENLILPPSPIGLVADEDQGDRLDRANVSSCAPMLTSKTGIYINPSTSGTPAGTITVGEDGNSDGIGTNVPPFTALYYIMKIAGRTSKNPGIVA